VKSSSIYERELKGILQADEGVLSRVIKGCREEEKENYLSIKNRPFMVIRAAGSFGVDLVAIRSDFSLPIEVKSSSSKKITFSHSGGRAQEQAERMRKECQRAGLIPIYAFRLKSYRGDAWRIFTLEIEGLEGRSALLYERIPKIHRSSRGGYVMKWDEGMKLSDFIGLLSGV